MAKPKRSKDLMRMERRGRALKMKVKIAKMQLMAIAPLMDAEMDNETRASIAAELHSISIGLEQVSRFLHDEVKAHKALEDKVHGGKVQSVA